MESLPGILAFVRSAEASSFAAAGRALGISPSAVGKSIARLEASVGVRLFQRSTRKVRLTAEGELFFERCRRILDELADAEAMLSQAAQSPRGKLRVSVPTIGYRFLLPVLPAFRRQYPEIELDLDFSDHMVDVIEEGVDVAIRSGSLPDSRLMARRLGPFRFLLCASPAYLDARGEPRQPMDLERHDFVRYRFATTGKLMEWERGSDPRWQGVRLATAITCNNMEAVLAATLDGHGIAYVPDFLVSESIRAGQLRPVMEDQLADRGQFWAVWSSSRQLSPKIRVFVDFIAGRLFREQG